MDLYLLAPKLLMHGQFKNLNKKLLRKKNREVVYFVTMSTKSKIDLSVKALFEQQGKKGLQLLQETNREPEECYKPQQRQGGRGRESESDEGGGREERERESKKRRRREMSRKGILKELSVGMVRERKTEREETREKERSRSLSEMHSTTSYNI